MTTEINITSATAAEDIYRGMKSPLILIIGKSGRGKSTAMRSLDPTKTCVINILGKPFPFPRGVQYREKENMLISSDPGQILKYMKYVSEDPKMSHVTNLIIDDGHYEMVTEFMNKSLEKGYDKFTSMAKNIFNILIMGTKLRSNLKVFFLCHEEDTGYERKIKTLGKLLDEKVTLEGLSTIVLFAELEVENDKRIYYFATQSNGQTTAKSPFDMFPIRIPNDLKLVSDRIDEYYQEIPLSNSKLDFTLK
jgi:hypothetical protein